MVGKRLTKEEFVERSIKIHGNRYDYSLVEYRNMNSKVRIICKEHGIFEQSPLVHLSGCGCRICSKYNKRFTQDSFIIESKKVHMDKYNYDLVKFTKLQDKVKIICPIHGVFEQRPVNHLLGCGCSSCAKIRMSNKHRSLRVKDVIERFNSYHNNQYDYSLIHDVTSSKKVDIICKKHGVFTQGIYDHENGAGCPICKKEKLSSLFSSSTSYFIEKAQQLHGDRYDYSLVNYKNSWTKVKIICNVHGAFNQRPNDHLAGNGCPKCKASKNEALIEYFLKLFNYFYITEYRIKECRDKIPLPFDFAIFEDEEKTKLKCLIEYDGEQHYMCLKRYKMTQVSLEEVQKRDKIKTDFCSDNNIKLIRIPYWEKDNIEKILMKLT